MLPWWNRRSTGELVPFSEKGLSFTSETLILQMPSSFVKDGFRDSFKDG